MFEQSAKEETLSIIKVIETDLSANQRTLSKKLGFSLGKTNYLLRELIKRGLVHATSFSAHPGKLRKVSYVLTPQGAEEKMRLIKYFLDIKEAEYNQLKEEWTQITSKII